MDTAALVLVIIVSATLTLFLIVLIVLIVLAIKLVKQLKLIADRAETAVDSVATAGNLIRNASGPLAALKIARNLMKHYKSKSK